MLKEKNLFLLEDSVHKCYSSFRNELREDGNIEHSSLQKEARLLKIYTNNYLDKLIDEVDIVKLNTLLDVLNGTIGSLNLRNHVQKYFQ